MARWTRAPALALAVAAGGLGCATPGPFPASFSVAPGSTAPLAEAAGPEVLSAVPETAEVVLLADLAQLRASPWTREILRSPAVLDETATRVAARGFDELVDVDELAMVGFGAAGDGAASLLVMRGHIDKQRVFEAAKKRWPTSQAGTFRGRALIISGAGDAAVAFATDTIFVSGPLAAVRSAIDCASGKQASVRRSDWFLDGRTALVEAHGRRGQAPAVELGILVTPAIAQRMIDAFGQAPDLRYVGARVFLQATLDLGLVGLTGTRGAANELATGLTQQVDQLRARKSLGALGLDVVLQSLRFSARGSRMEGALAVSEDQRDLVSEKLKMFAALMAQKQEAK